MVRALAGVVFGLHIVGWGVVWIVSGAGWPMLPGLATLAYMLGLRHAFDADHIAAIDNTTRRLMHDGRNPLGVGLYFSLGHSTVVFLMTIAVAVLVNTLSSDAVGWREAGQQIGGLVSGMFLYVVGVTNLIVLLDFARLLRQRRACDRVTAAAEPLPGGWIARWMPRLFALVNRPHRMYFVGFLFGLSFDTATEVAMLTTAGLAAAQSLPLAGVLALPIVFAAGMSLMDTADGVLMCGAYGWALHNPRQKAVYNLAITGVSVLAALVIGTMQLVSVAADRLSFTSPGLETLARLNSPFTGLLVAGMSIGLWVAAMLFARLHRGEFPSAVVETSRPPSFRVFPR